MVSKGKPEFSRGFWGYDPGQVDEYITAITNKHRETLTALAARLNEALAECSELSAEILRNTQLMDACNRMMQHLLFLSESLLDLDTRNDPDSKELLKANLNVEKHLSSLRKELNSGRSFASTLAQNPSFPDSPSIDDQEINMSLQDIYRQLINLKQNLRSILDIATGYTDRLLKYENILSENPDSYEIIKKAVRKAVFEALSEQAPAPREEASADLEKRRIQLDEPNHSGELEAVSAGPGSQNVLVSKGELETSMEPGHSSGKALVVDDSPTIRAIVRAVLEREGYEVLEAADGKEALEIVRYGPPCSLVILDLMLPYADGRQITKAIRENPNWCRVPVIILSLSTAEQDILSLFEAGASDYVVKPFSPLELGARIRRFKTPLCSRLDPGL